MPEVQFRVRWPDASSTLCYSPSSTIREAFVLGHAYPLQEFVARSRAALEHASLRVAQKYGFGCAHAALQIREIEQAAARYAGDPHATVTVESYE
ncbi:MSMEG_0570 family nitrogen starvation response protein [Solimonas flava]|uniref:MSMEG_0570 family nitrogen starvation response protein n=1 Tax=Solimonas flava TaxID=415849 RepID=UPI0004035156|nr:MSMEG_0570 family nitrogen starvation response protein [Solimonas flava]